ncbi:MAG: flavin reductase family protein [Alphaproteobacteria bacterium]|nr:flavin reductase family protein [Alphaproteobacteria bacterium]
MERTLRNAFGSFPTGVAIVTARDDCGQPIGITINSFTSLSLTPPLVLWSLRLQSRCYPVFGKAEHFAINVLSKDQINLSQFFAGQSRLADVKMSVGITGVPTIDDCVCLFECRRYNIQQGGDHAIFIGLVENFAYDRGGEPLVFLRGQYTEAAVKGPLSARQCHIAMATSIV